MRHQSAIAGIPVYVISLKDCETRRRNMTERLGALGIPFQFVDAIDGRTQRLPDVFDGARVVRQGFWGESALAGAMSHRKLPRMIANGSAEIGLVLEDDARPSDSFATVINRVRHLDFDVFKFEGSPHRRYVTLDQVNAKHSVVIGMVPSMGAAAYLLTRTAAQRLCMLPVLDQMIDEAFGDYRLCLRVLEIEPYVVVQDQETPTTINLQSYAGPPVQFRRGTIARLAHSIRKRVRLIRTHGPRIALALEFQKVTGTTR